MRRSLAPRLRAARAAFGAAIVILGCADLQVTLPGAVAYVRVTPDTVVLRTGDTARVRAAALDAGLAVLSQKRPVWVSNGPGVASVNDTGLIVAVGAGTATVTATVDGVQGTVTVIASGPPAAIAIQAGDNQSAAVNAMVAVAPAVLVTDAIGNPVINETVTFAVTSGGGSVTGEDAVTGLDGVATLGSWTLGPVAGANTLTATVSGAGVTGNPRTFTATGTVGPPSATLSTVESDLAAIAPSSGASIAVITVTVRDANGSTIAGANVTLAATGAGNILTQPMGPTDNFGRATGSFSSSVAEVKTISAAVNGAVPLTQTLQLTVSANAPAQIGVFTQVGGAISNADFTVQPVVDIQDAFGNRVPTANGPVTVSLFAGDGTLITSGLLTVNTVNGRATFAALRIRGTRVGGDTLGTGQHILQFTAPGFNAVRDTFIVAVSFAYNIVDVFSRNGCTAGCHGVSFTNYASTVNAATSISCLGRTRVVPGNTATSFLYDKLNSAVPACGAIMPTGGLMSVRQRQLVQTWILAGAPNN